MTNLFALCSAREYPSAYPSAPRVATPVPDIADALAALPADVAARVAQAQARLRAPTCDDAKRGSVPMAVR